MAFGNLLQAPFELNEFMMSKYHGTFFALLNPFALLCGVLALMLFVMQGATWLQMKTTEELHSRARNVAQITGLIAIALFVIAASGFNLSKVM
ncbi:cytochrome d ubiquinol oxidase subunit II [Vibrio lentus]|nr:cytochrome d ubiquinol oxidase subunit II [Vibrio lentus]